MSGTKFSNLSERFKYKFISNMKLKVMNLVAPLLNHPNRRLMQNYLINFAGTWFCLWLILIAFEVSNPLRKGFGIAVLIGIAEYYFDYVIHRLRTKG